MTSLDEATNYIKNRPYMSGIERDKIRIKQTEEIFTPDWLVEQCIDDFLQIEPHLFNDPKTTFLDPCCGDGQMLGAVLIRKMKSDADFETALLSIRGVDIMPDNVKLCQERLLCGREDLRYIIEQYIVCADALTYHYRFDGTDPDITEQDLHNRDIGLFAPKKSLDTQ